MYMITDSLTCRPQKRPRRSRAPVPLLVPCFLARTGPLLCPRRFMRLSEASSLAARWPRMPSVEKRQRLQGLIARITLNPEGLPPARRLAAGDRYPVKDVSRGPLFCCR